MKCLFYLLLVVYTFAAPESRIRLPNELTDRCATYIDSECFDELIYREHFNSYYNGIPTIWRCVNNRGKRDVFTDAAVGKFMDMKKREWKNNTIQYIISCKYTESERIFIANAMMSIEERTCMKFVPYEGRGDLFLFIDTEFENKCSANGQAPFGMYYNGEQRGYINMKYARSCFHEAAARGKNSVIHELMHVLGFMHQQDRADAYPSPGSADPSTYVTLGPYDRFSAVGYSWTRELTDLDAFKINKLYNCSRTARGNLAIDLSKPTSPPKRLAGHLKTFNINCPWQIKKAYVNIAHIIVDEANATLTLENQFNEQRTQCEIDKLCYLPFVHIRADGKLINTLNMPTKLWDNEKCVTYSLGDGVYPRYLTPKPDDKCIAVIQGNIAPVRAGPRFVCLVSSVNYKLVLNSQVLY